MWGQTKQAASATTALIYITVGALMDVWTIVYYMHLRGSPETSETAYLWCAGFFFSGVVLVIIGLAVGRIGRSALHAETAATPEQILAPPVIAPANGTVPAAAVPATPVPTVPRAVQPVQVSPVAHRGGNAQ
jgi:hypothetical protein